MNTYENSYKCLFIFIFFILLIIIFLLVLKNKKEKYGDTQTTQIPPTQIALTPANSANLIQVDPLTGDLSELNTNILINDVNNMIKNMYNNLTFYNANFGGKTTFTGSLNPVIFDEAFMSTRSIEIHDAINFTPTNADTLSPGIQLIFPYTIMYINKIPMITTDSNNNVAFNGSARSTSDYRLTTDIQPIYNPLERCLQLKPYTYRFINDKIGKLQDGFIAHEVQDILPNIVSGKKDDPYKMQSLDYSKITPLCVGAIQKLNEKVNKQQLIIQNLMERLEKLEFNRNFLFK